MPTPREPLPDLITSPALRRALWVRLLLVGGALVLVVLGIVGWIIPVVTGVPFYLGAAWLFGRASRRATRWINALDRKLPYRVRVALRRLTPRRRARRDETPAGR